MLIKKLAISIDLTTILHVTEHVPVEHRVVDRSAFRVGFAQSQMDGSANLFIKKHVAGKLIDVIVGADSKFTQIAGTLVGI